MRTAERFRSRKYIEWAKETNAENFHAGLRNKYKTTFYHKSINLNVIMLCLCSKNCRQSISNSIIVFVTSGISKNSNFYYSQSIIMKINRYINVIECASDNLDMTNT